MREKDREKFVRLANKRVNKVLKDLQLIGNLSDRSNYDYSEEDARKIFDAIKEELNLCEERFASNAKKTDKFQLE